MDKIILVTFILCYLHTASSIRCFECNSLNNSMCLDPTLYDRETLDTFLVTTECRRGVHAVTPDGSYEFFCRKIQQTILHKHADAEIRVTRGCGWMRHHRDCYKADNEDHQETVCQCFTDQCNLAHFFTPSQGVGILTVVVWIANTKL